MKPTKRQLFTHRILLEEARIVLANPGAFSKTYAKTCQAFRDQWGKNHCIHDDLLDMMALQNPNLNWRDVVRTLVAIDTIDHNDIQDAIHALDKPESILGGEPSFVVVTCPNCGKELGLPSDGWSAVLCGTCGEDVSNPNLER